MSNEINILKIKSISTNSWNPNILNDKDFLGLKKSLEEQEGNISNPILVRKHGKGYEIIDGEHRYKAMRGLGFSDIAAIIITADDKDARIQTIAMNKFRGTVDEVKLAELMVDLQTIYGMSDKEIEEKLGMTEEDISDAKELNDVAAMKHDETDLTDEDSGPEIVLKLDLSEEELDMIYEFAESMGLDVKSTIMMSVAESTRYINEGKEITKVVSRSEPEMFDIDEIDF